MSLTEIGPPHGLHVTVRDLVAFVPSLIAAGALIYGVGVYGSKIDTLILSVSEIKGSASALDTTVRRIDNQIVAIQAANTENDKDIQARSDMRSDQMQVLSDRVLALEALTREMSQDVSTINFQLDNGHRPGAAR